MALIVWMVRIQLEWRHSNAYQTPPLPNNHPGTVWHRQLNCKKFQHETINLQTITKVLEHIHSQCDAPVQLCKSKHKCQMIQSEFDFETGNVYKLLRMHVVKRQFIRLSFLSGAIIWIFTEWWLSKRVIVMMMRRGWWLWLRQWQWQQPSQLESEIQAFSTLIYICQRPYTLLQVFTQDGSKFLPLHSTKKIKSKKPNEHIQTE